MEATMKIAAMAGLIILTGLLMALPLMLLWNGLMPEIFGLIELDFWQSLGLSLLSNVLFKPNNSK